MSAALVISIIVLIIVLSMIVVFIAQAREKARIEAARKSNALFDRYRRLKRIVHDVPPQYLAKEIKLLLLERAIDTMEELKELKGDEFRYQAQLDEDQELLSNCKKLQKEPPAVQITDEEKLNEIRKLLQILMKFIENQARKRNISVPSAKKHIQNTKFYIYRSKADLYENRANAAIKKEKLRIAIHNLHSAVSELEKIAEIPEAQNAIKATRVKIKELETIADEQNKAKAQSATKTSAASKEWDEFLDDDDDWKKKNAYDD